MVMTSLLVIYVLFGVIGFLLGRKIKVQPNTFGWILLSFLVLISQWIFPGMRVIAVFALEMFANQILQAFFFGVLIGLLAKHTN